MLPEGWCEGCRLGNDDVDGVSLGDCDGFVDKEGESLTCIVGLVDTEGSVEG